MPGDARCDLRTLYYAKGLQDLFQLVNLLFFPVYLSIVPTVQFQHHRLYYISSCNYTHYLIVINDSLFIFMLNIRSAISLTGVSGFIVFTFTVIIFDFYRKMLFKVYLNLFRLSIDYPIQKLEISGEARYLYNYVCFRQCQRCALRHPQRYTAYFILTRSSESSPIDVSFLTVITSFVIISAALNSGIKTPFTGLINTKAYNMAYNMVNPCDSVSILIFLF